MDTDWAPGDLGVCVNISDIIRPDIGMRLIGGIDLELERLYRVTDIKVRDDVPSPFNILLRLEGFPFWKLAIRFRKVRPDNSGEIVDQEVFAMIKRTAHERVS